MSSPNTNQRHSVASLDGLACRYAGQLLKDLGVAAPSMREQAPTPDPQRWQRSGLAALTGEPEAAVTHCPVPIASLADGALGALRLLAGRDILPDYTGAGLLTVRAALSGLARQGATSAGGSCRILPCNDGHLAVNLPRDSDWASVEAWLQTPVASEWSAVAETLEGMSNQELIERARLLGLAVADAKPAPPGDTAWFELCHTVQAVSPQERAPRVIDLSSLWAGPLCSLLLAACGADVVKVESTQRPDGARLGEKAFFEFLNSEKAEQHLPLHIPAGREQLLELIRSADIVIEASRPRALRQMGISAEQLLESVPGLTWISITGYGRREPQANWIAYGDDAGVAAGLSAALYDTTGHWMFCGDAIADPFTGMHAARAALAAFKSGGGRLLSLSLVETLRHGIGFARELQVQ